MRMSKLSIAIALVTAIIFSSQTFAQSALEQLLSGDPNDPAMTQIAGDAKALVLTIDGVDSKLLPGKKLLTGLAATGRGDSYLVEPVKTNWGFADDVRHYSWSGDLTKTDEDIRNLKIQISGLSKIAQTRGKPFVILAHSWGSVLAYRAISELKNEGALGVSGIRKLVTVGSPIDAQGVAGGPKSIAAKDQSDTYINWVGVDGVLGAAESWTNFWIDRDKISGPIAELEHNVELKYSFFNPHSAYYANSTLLNRIGEVVAVDLASFSAASQVAASATAPEISPTSDPDIASDPATVVTVASTNSVAAPKTVPRLNSPSLYGIKIGMTLQDAEKELQDRMTLPEGKVLSQMRYNTRPQYWSEKIDCVDPKIEPKACLEGFRTTHRPDDGTNIHKLELKFIEDYKNRPGTPVVYSVAFVHSYPADQVPLDPVKVAYDRYGSPSEFDWGARDGCLADYEKYKDTKMGRRFPSKEECMRTPPDWYGWKFSSPLGNGTLRLTIDAREGYSHFKYLLQMELDEKISDAMQNELQAAFLRARSAQDSPF